MPPGSPPPTSAAVRKLRQAVERELRAAGVTTGDALVVACSFGPDSLALADAVIALRGRLHLGELTLCYVNHGLRPAAGREGDSVAALAAEHAPAVRAEIVTVTVDRKRGAGLEDAARTVRYQALDQAAKAAGARWILLGHTSSDQAETVVGRLLRGSGVVGLAGIPPRRGAYLRPMLGVDRAEVLAYLAARGLVPAHDLSNDDPSFLRNRVRHRILPILRSENPAVDQALVRTADALRELASALDWAVDQAAGRLSLRRTPSAVRLDAAGLAALPPAVGKRLLTRLGGDLGVSLDAGHLGRLLAMCARPPGGTTALALPRIRGRREYADLVLELRGGAVPPAVQAEVVGDEGPYLVRTWQPGDRMRPLSLKGRSRKLQDLFSDRKIPVARRREAVVIVREKDGAIVWAQYIGSSAEGNVQVSLTELDPAAINGGRSRRSNDS